MRKRILFGVVAVLAVLTVLLVPQPGSVSHAASSADQSFDVACDGRTFVINRKNPDQLKIVRGDTYVLNGAIYQGGAIPSGGTKSEPSSFGPDHSGSIGTWYCRGSFLVDGDQFNSEKLQRASTHYFLLQGKDRLITEGFEGSPDITRVIVGGVNSFAGGRGICMMQRLGINATGSYNMRFTFQMQ